MPYRLLQESEHLAIWDPALSAAIDFEPGAAEQIDLDSVMASARSRNQPQSALWQRGCR